MAVTIQVLTFNTMKLGTPVAPRDVLAEVVDVELGDGSRVAPDVIGFQEVFNTRYPPLPARNVKKELERTLGNEFVLRWDRASGPGIGNWFQDGLLVAARKDRFKVVNGDRVRFGRYGAFERRIGQFMALELEGGIVVHVYNTHLSVGEDKAGRRLDEIAKMHGFVRRKEEELPAQASLWMGDFNSVPESEEHRAVTCEGWRDTWEAMGKSGPQATLDPANSLVGAGKTARRIDFVFLKTRSGTVTHSEIVLHKLVDGNNLSDHYGVLTTVGIGP